MRCRIRHRTFTYDVVYDVNKTYDVVLKITVLAILTYDIVYDIVRFCTMSYTMSDHIIRLCRYYTMSYTMPTQHRYYTISRSIYDLYVRRRIAYDVTCDIACLALQEQAPCLTAPVS